MSEILLRTEDLKKHFPLTGGVFRKVIGNRILSFFTSLLAGRRITDSQSGLRAFKREVFEKMDIVWFSNICHK